jgi:hypothetical protein
MLLRFVETRGFSQAAKGTLSDDELRAVQLALIADPAAGATIGKTGGARKIRAALAGRGKRGGARVIYFHSPRTGTIYLLYVYPKNESDDLTDGERKALKTIIAQLAQEG